nr:hypothetical protein CFP56_63727 [Quercus suber]
MGCTAPTRREVDRHSFWDARHRLRSTTTIIIIITVNSVRMAESGCSNRRYCRHISRRSRVAMIISRFYPWSVEPSLRVEVSPTAGRADWLGLKEPRYVQNSRFTDQEAWTHGMSIEVPCLLRDRTHVGPSAIRNDVQSRHGGLVACRIDRHHSSLSDEEVKGTNNRQMK